MAQRRFHYEVAFEQYLRERAIPYVAVDEAKRALHRETSRAASPDAAATRLGADPDAAPDRLKSFDFVVYSDTGPNLLVDVKGRKHTGRSNRSLDNWVTDADVQSLETWQRLFGQGFDSAFAFLYWCAAPPPGALFQEVFTSGDRWYAVLAIRLADYRSHMRVRSPRWKTVSLPAKHFADHSVTLREML